MTNNFKLKHRSLILIILTSFYISNITAQTWLEKLDEVKLSLEKYNDCKTAERILQEIRSEAETEIMYKFYSAKVFKCKGDLEKYRDYLVEFNKIKEDPLIQDEIIDLNYQITKAKIAYEEKYGFKDGIYINYDSKTEKSIEYKLETNEDKSIIKIVNLVTGNYYNFNFKRQGYYTGTQTRLQKNLGMTTVIYEEKRQHHNIVPRTVEEYQKPCDDIDKETEATLEVVNSKHLKIKYRHWILKGCYWYNDQYSVYDSGYSVVYTRNSPCSCTDARKELGWNEFILELE